MIVQHFMLCSCLFFFFFIRRVSRSVKSNAVFRRSIELQIYSAYRFDFIHLMGTRTATYTTNKLLCIIFYGNYAKMSPATNGLQFFFLVCLGKKMLLTMCRTVEWHSMMCPRPSWRTKCCISASQCTPSWYDTQSVNENIWASKLMQIQK